MLIEPSDKMIFKFDGFTVDTEDFVVKRNGEVVSLTPRAFDVLRLLLRHSGHVVEKRQLFDEVWKETFVSDNALTKVIKELRHALADPADEPRYIETIPKRGYRFIGKLDENSRRGGNQLIADARSLPESASVFPNRPVIILVTFALIAITVAWFAFDASRGSKTPSTIAVLPFKPLDAESRNESLEFGMAESLITRLSNLREIVVRPIASVRMFNQPEQDPIKAGEALQTDAVLDGSIQKVGDRIRVTVRLINVRSSETLWSEQFDEGFTDIFKVQDSIAQRIASVLALKLSRDEKEQLAKHMTESPEAYENYVQGQFHWHRRGTDWIDESQRAFKRALDADPNFALAHVGVADTYIMLSGHRRIGSEEAATKAAPSIQRALELDNNLAQAHNALAELKYQYEYDWRGAEAEFKTALDLNPNVAWIHQAYGWFLMSEGRFDEASTEMDRARELDPSSITLAMTRGRLYYYSRNYDRAIQEFQAAMALEPKDPSPYLVLMSTYDQKGMYR